MGIQTYIWNMDLLRDVRNKKLTTNRPHVPSEDAAVGNEFPLGGWSHESQLV